MSWRAENPQIEGRSPEDFAKRLCGKSTDLRMRLVVLAAHPDDETIGASALLARYPQSAVIYMTDGAPRERRFWPPDMQGERERYADLRRSEASKALAQAGIAADQIVWLGAVDQEAAFEMPTLIGGFRDLLNAIRPDAVITHPYEGGHPDHDAAALVARFAIDGIDRKMRPELLEMTSYHSREGRCVTGEFLDSSPQHEAVLEFTEEDRERKRNMFRQYASQQLVLDNFSIACERIRRLLPADQGFGERPLLRC